MPSKTRKIHYNAEIMECGLLDSDITEGQTSSYNNVLGLIYRYYTIAD